MSERVWTPVELVRWTTGYFKEHGVPSPRLDAELLLAFVLGAERIDLYTAFDRPVDPGERERFRELVRERAQKRRPVAYLTGVREFWSRRFRVDESVLIPRPDTETLVRETLALAPRRVLEVGVGSGAVCGALALELPDAHFVATDLSERALEVARDNLATLGVAERCELHRADLVAGSGYDALVSNPPYIPTGDLAKLGPEIEHEPSCALDGGSDGLDVIRRLVACADSVLVPGGSLLIEIGIGQGDAVTGLMDAAGLEDVRLCPDLAGIPRVAAGRTPAATEAD